MAPGAVEAIAAWFNLSATPTDNFFDLGSGAGRLVLHMMVKGYARAATGIELNTGRHSLAMELAQRVLPEHLPVNSGLANASSGKSTYVGATFLQGDMLSANLSSATMLYLNPPCLPCEVQQKLMLKILNECNAKYVITSTPLDGLLKSGAYIEEHDELLKPMIGYNWSIPVAIYRRA